MSSVKFRSEILINGVNPYIHVPKDKVAKLIQNWKKPIPVIIQINRKPDQPWHINMVPMGNGDFYLYLHENVRKASSTKVGDRVNVSIEFDNEYKNGPQHEISKDFKTALTKNIKAKNNWEKLSPSRKKEVLRYFALLKSKEAIERNITKIIFVLSGNDGHFMGKDWKNGK